jgi:hypothetical protein
MSGPRSRQQRDWTRDETIVALAACPLDRQRYHSRSPRVREVADLLGRSPGAVSLKFGNIWSVHTSGAKGLIHAGEMVSQVYNEFEGRGDALTEAAADIRRHLISEDPTPRLESELPLGDAAARRRLGRIRRLAGQSGLELRYVVTYTRQGSVVLGLLFLVPVVLTHPDRIVRLISETADLLGRVIEKSRGWGLLLSGNLDRIARESVLRNAPGFHYNELSQFDERKFAIALGTTGPLEDRDPEVSLPRRLRSLTPTSLRKLIRRSLEINPQDLCDRCLAMAARVADKVERARSR